MYGFANVDMHASHMEHMHVDDARRHLNDILGRAMQARHRPDLFQSALDYNAKLVTALRLRKVKIWGDEPG